ncbi:MAG: hypothetical protein IPM21_05870 [Acidobacteria bacterium]|nr:hypothetical protein [Acidobacteriota bacterium]
MYLSVSRPIIDKKRDKKCIPYQRDNDKWAYVCKAHRSAQYRLQYKQVGDEDQSLMCLRKSSISKSQEYQDSKGRHEKAVRFGVEYEIVPTVIRGIEKIKGTQNHADRDDHSCDTQLFMSLKVIFLDQICLNGKYGKPQKHENPVDDKLRVTIAFLAYVGDQIV